MLSSHATLIFVVAIIIIWEACNIFGTSTLKFYPMQHSIDFIIAIGLYLYETKVSGRIL